MALRIQPLVLLALASIGAVALAVGCSRAAESVGPRGSDDALRSEARRQRSARREASAIQTHDTPQAKASAAAPPPTTSAAPPPPTPSTLPDSSSPAAPSAAASAAPAASTGVVSGPPTDTLCQHLCERATGCALEMFGGADDADLASAREAQDHRAEELAECRSHCERRLPKLRSELERCDAKEECEQLLVCIADLDERR